MKKNSIGFSIGIFTAAALFVVVGVAFWMTKQTSPPSFTRDQRENAPPLSSQGEGPNSSPKNKSALNPQSEARQPDKEGVQALHNRIDQEAERLSRLSSREVVNVLLEAIRNCDDIRLNVAHDLLVERARQGDDEETVRRIREVLKDSSPNDERREFLEVLGEMATKASAEALIDFVETTGPQDDESRGVALQAIADIGGYRDEDGRFREEISPVLEQHLASAENNEEEFAVLSRAIATIGNPHGIERLLELLEARPQRERADDISQALRNVRNPAAVEPLWRRLQQDPTLSTSVSHAAGDALAAMGRPEATEVLLQWATGAQGERQMEQVLAWFRHVRDERSLHLLLEVNNRQFRDQQIRERILNLAEQRERANNPTRINP